MILLTAATPWESGPLAKRWKLERTGATFRGRAFGVDLIILETGMGAAATESATGEPARTDPALVLEAVVCTGLAGALQPGVRSGELVADLRGAPLDWVQAARQTAAELGRPLHLGVIWTSDDVVRDPQSKRALGEARRAVAVDMEGAVVRRWAEGRSIEYLSVRAVLDAVDQRLPSGAPENDSPAAVARFAASHWRELPLMAALWPRQLRAMAALGVFLEAWLPRLAAQQANA